MINSLQIMRVIVLMFMNVQLLLAQEARTVRDTVQEFAVSGSVDSYFHKSIQRMEEGPRTSFANLSGFSLGMINLIGLYSSPKSGFVADIVLGPRGSDAIFHAPYYRNAEGGGSSQIINQMYAYYQVNNAIRVNIGQFNTFVGNETITPVKNFHYSMSYTFTYGPFNHTGVWADVALSPAWSAKIAVMNPTDYTEFNPFDSYTLGGQIGITKGKGSAYLSATYGDPDGRLGVKDSIGSVSVGNVLLLNLIASWNIFRDYELRLCTTARSSYLGQVKTTASTDRELLMNAGFYGLALSHKYELTDWCAFGLRTEFFEEWNEGVGAIGDYNGDGDAWAYGITLSTNITARNFRLIPEVRVDKTSQKTFMHSSSNAAMDQLVSVNMAVVYVLPSISRTINIR